MNVGVDVEADGSGRVRAIVELDRAAAEQVGDLEGQLRVDDLIKAGWTVDGPVATAGKGQRITAERRFSTTDEARAAMQQLSGPDGPFQDFRIERDSSFLRTKTRFTGRVDLQAGLEGFGDEELRERLGAPLGVDAEELRRRAGAALSAVFGFEVAVRLPGDVQSNAPTSADNGAVWRPKLGEDVELTARAEQWNAASIGFAALALLTGLAACIVAARQVRRPRHRRRA